MSLICKSDLVVLLTHILHRKSCMIATPMSTQPSGNKSCVYHTISTVTKNPDTTKILQLAKHLLL